MRTFTVGSDCDLKTFTDGVYPQGGFCLAALLRNRDVKVNGKRMCSNAKLKRGDEVTYYLTPAQESKLSHTVVYEDENVRICDKFSGVTSEGLCSELNFNGTYYPVHRLDRNTAGLIVFAKNEAAERELLAAFRDRRIKKTYIAICKDCFSKESATVTAYMLKDGADSFVRVYDRPVKGGVTAVTEYRVLCRGDGLALVGIELHTGRTHQIRAHMAHIGCPVLGDEKYGDRALNAKFSAKRQRLVAKRLRFELVGGLAYLNAKPFESEFSFSELSQP